MPTKRPPSFRFRVWINGEESTHVFATNLDTAKRRYAQQRGVDVKRVRAVKE